MARPITAPTEPYVGSTHAVVAEVLDALINSQKALSRLEAMRGYRVRALILSIDAPVTAARYDDAVSAGIEEMALHLVEKLRQAVPA